MSDSETISTKRFVEIMVQTLFTLSGPDGDALRAAPQDVQAAWLRWTLGNLGIYTYEVGANWACIADRGRPHHWVVEAFDVAHQRVFSLPGWYRTKTEADREAEMARSVAAILHEMKIGRMNTLTIAPVIRIGAEP